MTATVVMKIECHGDSREIIGVGLADEGDLCPHEEIVAKLVAVYAQAIVKAMDDPKNYHPLVMAFAANSIMATANGVPIPEIMNDLYRAMEDSLKEFRKTEEHMSKSPADMFAEMVASFAKHDGHKEE